MVIESEEKWFEYVPTSTAAWSRVFIPGCRGTPHYITFGLVPFPSLLVFFSKLCSFQQPSLMCNFKKRGGKNTYGMETTANDACENRWRWRNKRGLVRNETGGSWNERTDHTEELKTRKKRGEQEDRGKTRRHLEEWAEKKTLETEKKTGGRERVPLNLLILAEGNGGSHDLTA